MRKAVLERRRAILETVEGHQTPNDNGFGGTRDVVLRWAVTLFAEHGFEACTMRGLAAAADVRPPALYHHFSSKQQILAEAMWLALGDFLVAVLGPLDEEPPSDWLHRIVSRHTAFQIEHRDLASANDLLVQREMLSEHMPHDEHLAFNEAGRGYFQIVRDLGRVRSGARSHDRANIDAFAIIAACDRVSIWYSPEGKMDLAAVTRQTWALVERILG